jgi:two-component system phosphate regulon sensor histidine kinase PhoR
MPPEQTRILVVDDEPGIREGCRKVLSAQGYQVVLADNGLAGLEAFRRGPAFAAALVDLKMPRMSGMELLEKVRGIDEDAVLLVITAFASIDTAVEATKRGAYGYIPKPFTPDELLLPVRNGLAHRALVIEARNLRAERERRLLEVAYERTKSRTIINCMTDGVLVVNSERQVVLRNPAAERILPAGAPVPGPLEGLPCEALRDLVSQVLVAGTGPLILSREVTLDGSTYMVNASPVAEPGGGILGAVIVLRDITAVSKLAAVKATFVSMVAHEVRSPLAAIESLLTSVLCDGIPHDPQGDRETVRRAIARSKSLRLMVSELMNLAAMETGHFVLTRRPVDVAQIVRDLVEAQLPRAREKALELSFCCNGEPAPKVLADEQALASVFGNIVDNAIKYTPQGGQVKVTVANDLPAYVRVTVQDTGIGIAEEDRAKIFDEFFRVRNRQTADIGGTGLGLTVARRLVDMHNGKITVDSTPGRGSRFTVRIPLAEQEA